MFIGAKNLQLSVFQDELAADIPVVKTSIAGTRLVGRMTVGRWQIMSECLANIQLHNPQATNMDCSCQTQ